MRMGRLLYNQNWNIGFCNLMPYELIQNKSIPSVRWMRHSYRDRWFADPFILKITADEIVVFVEECLISDNPKGIICELLIDRKSMRLKKRYVLLELDTHLSYPAIIRHQGKVYVYPENGASGKLNIYEYDSVNHKLINPICILGESVADASIIYHRGEYYMSTTKFPETQEKAYLYVSDSLFGEFKQVQYLPFQTDKSCSRQGGDWFSYNGSLYRPAQDCFKRYGSALSIMRVSEFKDRLKEEKEFTISPNSYKYNRGIHTINFRDGLCVVDGYGYLHPMLGHLYDLLRSIKHIIL